MSEKVEFLKSRRALNSDPSPNSVPLFVEKFALPHKMYESDSKQASASPILFHPTLPDTVENDQAVDRQTILTVRAYVTAKSLSKVCFIRTTATKLNCGQEGWVKAKRDLDLTPHPTLTKGLAGSLSVLVF